jgi:hypothetical protein
MGGASAPPFIERTSIMEHNPTLQAGIRANLDAMHKMLTQAVRDTAEARRHISHGEQNMAMGTLLTLDALLEHATTLHRAILALHRSRLCRRST